MSRIVDRTDTYLWYCQMIPLIRDWICATGPIKVATMHDVASRGVATPWVVGLYQGVPSVEVDGVPLVVADGGTPDRLIIPRPTLMSAGTLARLEDVMPAWVRHLERDARRDREVLAEYLWSQHDSMPAVVLDCVRRPLSPWRLMDWIRDPPPRWVLVPALIEVTGDRRLLWRQDRTRPVQPYGTYRLAAEDARTHHLPILSVTVLGDELHDVDVRSVLWAVLPGYCRMMTGGGEEGS